MVAPQQRNLVPLLLLLALASSCSREASPQALAPSSTDSLERGAPAWPMPSREGNREAQLPAPPAEAEVERPLVRCVADDAPHQLRTLDDLEELALAAEETGDLPRMLACAEEALRLSEDDVAAAHLRAEALVHLGRLEEARDAFTLALALSPDDPWILAGAAHLYVNLLPPSRQNTWIARSFAERGLALVPRSDKQVSGRLHLLSAWALADLGNFRHALGHANAAAELLPEERDPQIARGRALFELTRFEGAVRLLRKAIRRWPEDAEAFHLLGLSLERIPGHLDEAEAFLAKATSLDPVAFPQPIELGHGELDTLIREEIAALPERERAILQQERIPVRLETAPDLVDLRTEEPPLSPTAVGMFRGAPLGAEDAASQREILLFARNLRRSAASLPALRQQVRITLRHEVGHLLGEDEASLRARGLE